MKSKFKKSLATVFTENGFHRVMMPSGEVIPHDIETLTVSKPEFSEVTVKFLCNVAENREAALKNYQEDEEKPER
jgi:hypothetical protein